MTILDLEKSNQRRGELNQHWSLACLCAAVNVAGLCQDLTVPLTSHNPAICLEPQPKAAGFVSPYLPVASVVLKSVLERLNVGENDVILDLGALKRITLNPDQPALLQSSLWCHEHAVPALVIARCTFELQDLAEASAPGLAHHRPTIVYCYLLPEALRQLRSLLQSCLELPTVRALVTVGWEASLEHAQTTRMDCKLGTETGASCFYVHTTSKQNKEATQRLE
eukprot:gene9923-261_t